MEREAKRKAASGAAGEIESRPSKRQKVPGDADPVTESVDSTVQLGLQFVQSLRNAKDKTGRPIADHFLTLPDKNVIPEYYDEIKLPIAIDTIEGKLQRGEYTSLSQVESDCKRMVTNAKTFNDKKSAIYDDAERIRKTASNFMTKHNPAYRDGNYQAQPTPIPGEETIPNRPPNRPSRPAASTPKPATPASNERSRRAATAQQTATPAPSKLRRSSAAEEEENDLEFAGKTYQQAQEQIMRELIDFVDESSGLQIFQPFINLPSRSLKDYYQLIKQPMSLQGVQKKVNGVIGRNPPTGNTVYGSWDAFENDVSLIWRNAREYNEDGSEMYDLSIELEDMFKKFFEEAKQNVEEPPQPKLKLNMSAPKNQSLKLRLGQRTSPAVSSDPNTPTGRSSATPGVIVDSEALQRQQRHVADSMQPKPSERNPFNAPRNASIPPLSAGLPNGSASPAVNGVKHDPNSVQSPALNSIRPASTPSGYTPTMSMPPPQSLSRPTSGSPHPNGPVGPQTQGYPQQAPNYYVPPASLHTDLFRPTPLKNPSEALIPKVVLKTHPGINNPRPWSAFVSANRQKTQSSATFHLQHSHHFLQVIPHLPIARTQRLYRVFVTVNNNRTLETSRPINAGMNGNGVGYEGSKKKGEPLYEAKLVSGINKVEVEVIAEKEMKKGEKPGKDDVEKEKCTIFVDLARG